MPRIIPRELPPPCRWVECRDGGIALHWHYGCIASVRPDGMVTITWAWGVRLQGKAASLAQGRRYVERWVAARPGLPPGRRAMETRARMRAAMAEMGLEMRR